MPSPAEISLQQGNVPEALANLQDQVRKDPSNPKLRVFMFQLLAVAGQWQRALTQLNVCGELDAATLLMVQTYRTALQCEVLRAEIFAGKRSPLIFGDPQQWLALLIEALRLEADQHVVEAAALRSQALELAPTSTGTVNGTAFTWLADADSRLGPVLEAIVKGNYYWIPIQQIRSIEIEKPSDLRDSVWLPAVFTWSNGGQASGLIPTRYPGSEAAVDSLLCLARKTVWQDKGNDNYHGLGQRLLATDSEDYPLMEIRSIKLQAVAD